MENIPPAADEQQQQQQQQQQRKRRRQHVVEPAGPPPPLCEFELERQRRIQRNRQILADMGVHDAAAAVQQAMNNKRPRATKRKAPLDAEALQPSRRSNRIACALTADGGPAPPAAAEAAGARQAAADEEPDASCLLTQAEYFALQGQQLTGFESDGHFKGWVSPDVCERYGIAADPDAAWQAGGGGTFHRRPDMSAVPAEIKQRGWSDAKAFAATQLRKNNSFFYRHVAPHQQQANGEWSEAELERFMETARTHGVGDKWGLFASHIGSRVGYQCSAFYRDIIIAQGLIADKRFKMTPAGRVVFVGP